MMRDDQACGLRSLFVRQRPAVLGVLGEGSSRIALEIARALHDAGRRVLLLDRTFGEVARALGRAARWELKHGLAGERTLQHIALEAAPGLVVMPAARALEGLDRQPAAQWWSLCEALDALGPFDVVLLAGAPPAVPEAGVLLCLAPTSTAITQAYTELKRLGRRAMRRRCDIVVHGTRSEAAALDAFDSVALTAGRFLGMSLALAGTLPGGAPDGDDAARHGAAMRIGERLLAIGSAPAVAVNH
jgi:MinD-like ATPase involved in chromosome partitioning or flagellar assembly